MQTPQSLILIANNNISSIDGGFFGDAQPIIAITGTEKRADSPQISGHTPSLSGGDDVDVGYFALIRLNVSPSLLGHQALKLIEILRELLS